MKAVFALALFTLMCVTAEADMLKLRDGRTVAGQFLGATRTEIWFQRDVPGEGMGTMAYPIAQVESLTFGSDARQGSSSSVVDPVRPQWCEESQKIFRNAAWRSSPCTNPRSTRKDVTLQP